jgi:GNAT superfamily N-acetyltransferase
MEIRQSSTSQQIEDVKNLMRVFVGWHRERYHDAIEVIDRLFDHDEFGAELSELPGEFSPPRGRLLLASEGDQAAASVALRDMGDDVCEMKRMFVHSDYQGRGLGRLLADEVIREARQIGYKSMRLYTGDRQHEAQSLYENIGFKPIGAYYDFPDDVSKFFVFMELDLTD